MKIKFFSAGLVLLFWLSAGQNEVNEKIAEQIAKEYQLKNTERQELGRKCAELAPCQSQEEIAVVAQTALQALKEGKNINEAVQQANEARNTVRAAMGKTDDETEKAVVAGAAAEAIQNGLKVNEAVQVAAEAQKQYREAVKTGEPKKEMHRITVQAAGAAAREINKDISGMNPADRQTGMELQKRIKENFQKHYTAQKQQHDQARQQEKKQEASAAGEPEPPTAKKPLNKANLTQRRPGNRRIVKANNRRP